MASCHIVLMRPEIPQNVGSIIRLSVNCGVPLHLIRPFGFIWDERKIKRAALDYWHQADIHLHEDFTAYEREANPSTIYAFTSKTRQKYTEVEYQAGGGLLFGNESSGLAWQELESCSVPIHRVTIPMASPGRSLNLANAVAVGVFEAWRQFGWQA